MTASPPPTLHSCAWCGATTDASAGACTNCGAPVDVRLNATQSGWYELPAIKDMARIQIGRSTCQIEGTYVPVADMSLAPGDGVYFTHHVLLWADPSVSLTQSSLRGGWKRMMAGLPLHMLQAQGPGHIAFSRDAPGELVALPLEQGQSVDVREHLFMVATNTIAYDWFDANIWYTTGSGNEQETHYPLGQHIDRFTAQHGHGLLLLHAAGNAFVRRLQPGETILAKPTALLYKDTTVTLELHFEHPSTRGWSSWRSWSNRYIWVRVHGPGRVAVQSAFEHLHDEGATVSRSSGYTRHQW